MLWSKAFIYTLKDTPQEAEALSHQLMLRAGLIRMLSAGVYSYLPLGLKALYNIQGIIRQEMNAAGANELLLAALQPKELWVKSGRDKDMGEVMIRFIDRRGRNMCLGPTHEEVITDLAKNYISSYKQLPIILYQIQTKFRDEIRPRFGLIRACEFIMKDAYSFDRDLKGLEESYQVMFDAYQKIFKRCGLNILTVKADPGVMGGDISHEFMVPAENGEDLVGVCPECNAAFSGIDEKNSVCSECEAPLKKINAIEIGHIFRLGTKYSKSMGAYFLDAQGKQNPVIMGCYGIGVSRLLPTIIEQSHDENGIIWPLEVSPNKVIIVALDSGEEKIMKLALGIHDELERQSIDVLLDDREERAGVKFKDADLLGIPVAVVIGQKGMVQDKLEIKIRKDKSTLLIERRDIVNKIKELLEVK